MNYRTRRPGPLREGRNVASKCGVVDLVNKEAEEGSGLITWVGLKFRVDFDDKRRSDGRK